MQNEHFTHEISNRFVISHSISFAIFEYHATAPTAQGNTDKRQFNIDIFSAIKIPTRFVSHRQIDGTKNSIYTESSLRSLATTASLRYKVENSIGIILVYDYFVHNLHFTGRYFAYSLAQYNWQFCFFLDSILYRTFKTRIKPEKCITFGQCSKLNSN